MTSQHVWDHLNDIRKFKEGKLAIPRRRKNRKNEMNNEKQSLLQTFMFISIEDCTIRRPRRDSLFKMTSRLRKEKIYIQKVLNWWKSKKRLKTKELSNKFQHHRISCPSFNNDDARVYYDLWYDEGRCEVESKSRKQNVKAISFEDAGAVPFDFERSRDTYTYNSITWNSFPFPFHSPAELDKAKFPITVTYPTRRRRWRK